MRERHVGTGLRYSRPMPLTDPADMIESCRGLGTMRHRSAKGGYMDGVIRITDRQRWLISMGIGAVVAVVAIADLLRHTWYMPFGIWALGLLVGAAVATMRMRPHVALGLAWVAGLAQIFGNIPFTLAELALLPVPFFAARWGSRRVAILGGLTDAGVLIAVLWASSPGIGPYLAVRNSAYPGAYNGLIDMRVGLLTVAALAISWLFAFRGVALFG